MFNNIKIVNKGQLAIVTAWIIFLVLLTLFLNLLWNPWYLDKIKYNSDPDSSVFAYGGKLVADGKLPYRDFWDHKPPAVFYVDALFFRLMGISRWTFWWSNIIWIAITTILFFLLLRRMTSTFSAILASGVFLITFMYPSYFVGGNMPETYGTLPQVLIIGASFFLFLNGKPRWAFITGFLTAVAFLFKQTTISPGIGAILAIVFLGFRTRDWRKAITYIILFSLGVVIPLALVMVIWATAGSLGELWDAVVVYNLIYVGGGTSLATLGRTLQLLFVEFPYMPVTIATVGAMTVFFIKNRQWLLSGFNGSPIAGTEFIPDQVIARQYSLLAVFIALPFGVAFVALGGRNYLHYYTTLVPLFAAACAYLFMQLTDPKFFPPRLKALKAMLILLLIVMGIIWLSDAYSSEKPEVGIRNSIAKPFYGPVPLSEEVQYVLNNTQPDDSILIWGNNIGLYLWTNRHNPSRYLYPQPLFLPTNGRESRFDQFLDDIQRDPPALIFGLDSPSFGLPTINAPDADLCPMCIPAAVQGMKRLKDYVNENYVIVTLEDSTKVYKRNH